MDCPICDKGKLKRGTHRVPFTYRGNIVEVKQPGDWCESCGEGVLSAADLAVTTKARHDAIARVEGLLLADEIREIRTKLGLSQVEAGNRFGGGINAFSRYERGETMQPRSLDQLLRLLDKYPKHLKELDAA